MAVARAQKLTHRSVIGHGVRLGQNGRVIVARMFIAGELAAQVVFVLPLLLYRIGARAIGLPSIDLCAGQGVFQRVRHPAVHQHRYTAAIIG